MGKNIPVTVAYGDGIGPEIMKATLKILEAAEAPITTETIEVGKDVYLQGYESGISQQAWEKIRKNQVFLKAPITTPQGGGYKSLNVTIRKSLGLFANVRPCTSYHPFVGTRHPEMDVAIIRENEEDLYAGIEHRQTQEVTQGLKLISRPGCEKIVRYAFEYARQNNRKKVTCITKDNIMKRTDGLFHEVFNEIGEEYPDIQKEHWIVDIATAKLANNPENFDVIVTENLYGDIISDVAAEIVGSVGLAGSSNIGKDAAMFEAIHGSAPDIAGKNIANPSGLLMGAVMMLVHLNQYQTAEKIHNAWLKTIEDGIHTPDIYKNEVSKLKVGTEDFTEAVIRRIGETPQTLKPVKYNREESMKKIGAYERKPSPQKELIGVDIFIDWKGYDPEALGNIVQKANTENVELKSISNRGLNVWPDSYPGTFLTDHWQCRFMAKKEGEPVMLKHILSILQYLHTQSLEFIKTENLYTFDGEYGFSDD